MTASNDKPFGYMHDRAIEILRSADVTGGTLFMAIPPQDNWLIDWMVRDGYLTHTEDGDLDIGAEGFEWLAQNPEPAQAGIAYEIRGRRFGSDQEFIVGRCATRHEAMRVLAICNRLAIRDPSIQHTKRWIVEVPA